MRKENLLKLLAMYKQDALIKDYGGMSPHQQNIFLKNLGRLDIKLVFKLHKRFSSQDHVTPMQQKIQPARIITIPETDREKELEQKARQEGEKLLKDGKVAVLIVAGGQGSRLGFDGPKGFYPISPVKNKTLFQLFAEQVKAVSIRYNTWIPLLIMTSEENHDDTVNFFETQRYFGLNKNTIFFFRQDILPAITPDGEFVLKNDTDFFANPDGHGGSLKGLFDSGMLDMLTKKGITELFYCQVDNPLVKIADPVFLGYHAIANAEVSTKVVRRRSIEEKVGVYLNRGSKEAIIEYSDLEPEYMSALDDKGNILYWAGNTAIHIFSLPFIKKINKRGFALPYHCAKKKVDKPARAKDGRPTSLDIWKFETFVFDAIPLAERTCCMEVSREEEFAPVKNKDGTDSPETTRQAMIDLFRNWLEKADIKVTPGAAIEISPLFALDENELIQKIKNSIMPIETDTYFGE